MSFLGRVLLTPHMVLVQLKYVLTPFKFSSFQCRTYKDENGAYDFSSKQRERPFKAPNLDNEKGVLSSHTVNNSQRCSLVHQRAVESKSALIVLKVN